MSNRGTALFESALGKMVSRYMAEYNMTFGEVLGVLSYTVFQVQMALYKKHQANKQNPPPPPTTDTPPQIPPGL